MENNALLLRGIEFVGKHGVEKNERIEGRSFRVDVDAAIGQVNGFESDDLADTIDYERLAGIVYELGTGTSCHLVEHLAEKMAARCLEERHVIGVTVTIYKKATGVPGNPDWVGVRVVRGAS